MSCGQWSDLYQAHSQSMNTVGAAASSVDACMFVCLYMYIVLYYTYAVCVCVCVYIYIYYICLSVKMHSSRPHNYPFNCGMCPGTSHNTSYIYIHFENEGVYISQQYSSQMVSFGASFPICSRRCQINCTICNGSVWTIADTRVPRSGMHCSALTIEPMLLP